jgi:PPOX class probable F420-dependent enzyme
MDLDAAREHVRANAHAVLATTRRDGTPQLSPVTVAVDDDGRVVISSRETAVKVKNLRRTPTAWLCVLSDRFYGPWVQLEGRVAIVSLPDAMEPLVDYYRRLAGEHDDWDDYRAAMVRDRRAVVRLRPDHAYGALGDR